MKKKHHIANWLSNLSVATIAIGAFQTVELIPELEPHTKWVVLGIGLIEFFLSYLLAKEE